MGDKISHIALKGEHETETPPISEWQVWAGEPSVWHFWTTDLRAARQQLLESGRSPRVSLESLCLVDRLG